MKPLGATYTNAVASGESARLVPGGYIAVITAVEDIPLNPATNKGDYLKIEFDICEGEFIDYFKEMNERLGWDNGNFVRSYKETAMGMFKGFLEAIDKSNGTDFSVKAASGFNEHELIGKTVGVIMGEEEYKKNDGSIGTKIVVKSTRDTDTIRSGKFTIPEIKRLAGASAPSGFGPVNDDDIPFA